MKCGRTYTRRGRGDSGLHERGVKTHNQFKLQ